MRRIGDGNLWLVAGLLASAIGVLAVLTALATMLPRARDPALPIDLPPAVAVALRERLATGEIGEPVQIWRVWLARDGRIWYRLRVSAPGGARVWTHAVYDVATDGVGWVDWISGTGAR